MDLSEYQNEINILKKMKNNTDLLLDLDKTIIFLTNKLHNTNSFNSDDLELLTKLMNYKQKYIDNILQNTEKLLEN